MHLRFLVLFRGLIVRNTIPLSEWTTVYVFIHQLTDILVCFLGGSDGEESACNVGDLGSTPGLGRCPEDRNGYPLQYFCLENPMDREA